LADALHFVIGRQALSFGWNEPYEAIARRDERLRDISQDGLARARAIPPGGDLSAPTDTWDIVLDHVPDGMPSAEVKRRCRRALGSIRPVLGLIMRRGADGLNGQGNGCR
jgi:hypothetical protein